MKEKLDAIKKIVDEMENLMMMKMGKQEIPEEEMEEEPVKIKMMKIEAKPEEDDEYEMESDDGEAIDMTPIRELRNRLRGK
jgi:hypothetical protein